MVKKRARAARVMVTRGVGNEEGGDDGGNMARNNDDALVPVVVQQALLHSASARHRRVDRTTTGVHAPHGRCRRRPNDDDDDGNIVLPSSRVTLGAQFITLRVIINELFYNLACFR